MPGCSLDSAPSEAQSAGLKGKSVLGTGDKPLASAALSCWRSSWDGEKLAPAWQQIIHNSWKLAHSSTSNLQDAFYEYINQDEIRCWQGEQIR